MKEFERAKKRLVERRQQLVTELDAIDKKLGVVREVEALLAETFGDEAPPAPRKKPGPKPQPTAGVYRRPEAAPPPRNVGKLKSHCLRGHPRTPENVYASGQCKKCLADKAAARKAGASKKSAKRAPAADDEERPVRTDVSAAVPKVAPVSEPIPSVPRGPKWPMRAPTQPNEPLLTTRRTTPAVDVTAAAPPPPRSGGGKTCTARCYCHGKQCSLPTGHANDHSASGHMFRKALPEGAAAHRSLDERATSRPNAGVSP